LEITNKKNKTIYVTAIDTAGHGFNVTEAAFKKPTNGHLRAGVLEVMAQEVPLIVCSCASNKYLLQPMHTAL
jgi:hypothetical protein